MKKSQGMPLNVIVIAALAILVLVVLSIILINYYGKGVNQLDSCTSQGGQCCSSDDVKSGKYIILPAGDCSGNSEGNTYCCKEP